MLMVSDFTRNRLLNGVLDWILVQTGEVALGKSVMLNLVLLFDRLYFLSGLNRDDSVLSVLLLGFVILRC